MLKPLLVATHLDGLQVKVNALQERSPISSKITAWQALCKCNPFPSR